MWKSWRSEWQEGRRDASLDRDLDSRSALALSIPALRAHGKSQSDGVGLKALSERLPELSTEQKGSERPQVSSGHFGDFGTLTFLSLDSPPASMKLVNGVLWCMGERIKAFKAVGFASINPVLSADRTSFTLREFPANASIAFMWSRGWWLAFNGSILKDPILTTVVTSRISHTVTSSRPRNVDSTGAVIQPLSKPLSVLASTSEQ